MKVKIICLDNKMNHPIELNLDLTENKQLTKKYLKRFLKVISVGKAKMSCNITSQKLHLYLLRQK